ncbi:MAG: hypothetical protein WAX69_01635 [Victivallales bacterium]
MHIKTIKDETKREPPPSGVYRTLEYLQGRPGIYMGGIWHAEDEIPRRCRQKWILQAMESKREGRSVIKKAKHVCTINFYHVVNTLRDISQDKYLETFMALPYMEQSLARCFGTGDSQETVQKATAAIANIVTQVMTKYNESEESRVREENKAIRLEVARKIAVEEQSYSERRRLLEMREIALEEDMRPVREAAIVLAEKFFRQAVMECHPDITRSAAEVEIANERMITLLAVKKETLEMVKTARQLPEDCQKDDIPF